MTYRIRASFKGLEERFGYSVFDFFRNEQTHVLKRSFATPEEAERAASAAYLGPDMEGVEVQWDIEPEDPVAQVLDRLRDDPNVSPSYRAALRDAGRGHLVR